MHFLFSVRQLFASKIRPDATRSDSVSANPTWLNQDGTPKERIFRSMSQAEVQETTDPKQLVPIESLSKDNQPTVLSHSELEHNAGASAKPDDSQLPAIGEIEELRGRNPARYIIVIPIILAITVVALGLGLGLGLGLPDHKKKPVAIQSYGAINGSGIVALDLDNTTKITAYTQRYDGVIVKSEYQNGLWSGGTDVGDLVTANASFNSDTLAARNGTPLMALSYVNDDELLWHVFYVTVDNFLSDWVSSNLTQGWSQGTLRSGNFAVSSSPHVGLSACVNTQWYGAPYNLSGLGIRLYYGRSDDTIQEIGWNLGGQTAWFKGSSFPNSNGAGGVECTVRFASITYVWMENLQNELQEMWYDFNMSAGTANHTVGTWVTGLNYPDILHNSAISAINDFTIDPPTKNVHFQTPDLSILEIISNGTAETSAWERNFTVGTGMNHTRIGSVVLNTGIGGGQEIHVIYQTNATNMFDFIRDLTNTNWAVKLVPVGV